jgi:hypothetical protein
MFFCNGISNKIDFTQYIVCIVYITEGNCLSDIAICNGSKGVSCRAVCGVLCKTVKAYIISIPNCLFFCNFHCIKENGTTNPVC